MVSISIRPFSYFFVIHHDTTFVKTRLITIVRVHGKVIFNYELIISGYKIVRHSHDILIIITAMDNYLK